MEFKIKKEFQEGVTGKDPFFPSPPLVFGDKKQIEELKEQIAKTEFCRKCNAVAKEWWDEGSGDYYECENCRITWWYQGGKVKYETF